MQRHHSLPLNARGWLLKWVASFSGEILSYYVSFALILYASLPLPSRVTNFSLFLVRFNALSRAIESAFQKEGIPNRVLGGHKFFERVEVRPILFEDLSAFTVS
jgi:hypothetical protein